MKLLVYALSTPHYENSVWKIANIHIALILNHSIECGINHFIEISMLIYQQFIYIYHTADNYVNKGSIS